MAQMAELLNSEPDSMLVAHGPSRCRTYAERLLKDHQRAPGWDCGSGFLAPAPFDRFMIGLCGNFHWFLYVFAYGSKAVRAFLRFLTFVVDCQLTSCSSVDDALCNDGVGGWGGMMTFVVDCKLTWCSSVDDALCVLLREPLRWFVA